MTARVGLLLAHGIRRVQTSLAATLTIGLGNTKEHEVMFKRIASTALMVGLLAIGSTAHAGVITGGILFSGLLSLTPGGSNLGNATGIDFTGAANVLAGSGSYAGVPGIPNVGSPAVTMADFTFNPFAGPITPLWTFMEGGDTYSFTLTSMSILVQSAATLSLRGYGMATINGVDDTLMTFSLTTQAPLPGTSLYSYSASTSAVPEPATLGLLGMGLLGLGARARRRRQA